jgi:hypothetical protein
MVVDRWVLDMQDAGGVEMDVVEIKKWLVGGRAIV